MANWQRYIYLACRAALAGIFISGGAGMLLNWHGIAAVMAKHGMFAVPLFQVGAVVLEFGGALLLVTGFKTRIGALMLMVFLVPTTLIFHNFWAVSGPGRQMVLGEFLKNLSILGGLGIVAGDFSISNQEQTR